MVTAQQLREIMPYAGGRIALYLEPLNLTMEEFEISESPLRMAAFLAQLAHESGQLRYTAEIATGEAYDHRADLGNTSPEAIRIARLHDSTPGRWWKGHGLIQVTGFNNHMACGEALGLDLLNEPELLRQPLPAARSAGWFWDIHNLNDLADRRDFKHITKIINGGFNHLREREVFYADACNALGVQYVCG